MWHRLLLIPVMLFALVCLAQLPPPAAAQQTSSEITREGIAELSDEQVRRLLLEKLSENRHNELAVMVTITTPPS